MRASQPIVTDRRVALPDEPPARTFYPRLALRRLVSQCGRRGLDQEAASHRATSNPTPKGAWQERLKPKRRAQAYAISSLTVVFSQQLLGCDISPGLSDCHP